MKIAIKQRWWIGFLALGFFSNAWAHIPPSSYLIQKLAKKHAGFKSVRVRSTVTALDDGQPTSVKFNETLYYNPGTGVIRSQAFSATRKPKRLYNIEFQVGAGQGDRRPFGLVSHLLFDSSSLRVSHELRKNQIPVKLESELLEVETPEERRKLEVSFLDRYHGRYSWVIGRKDDSDHQLWMEKDGFVPLLLKAGNLIVEFGRYTYNRGAYPYPRELTLFDGEDAVMKVVMKDVKVFDRELEFKKKVTPGYTKRGKKASGGVRDLLQRFYRNMR